jgi:hypothetical protein
MYNVDENHHGITFQLVNTTSQPAGTVLIIIFQLDPVGSTTNSSSTTPTPGASTSSGGNTLSLSGPTTNKLGSKFNYEVSAHLAAPALFLAFNPAGTTCAATASSYPRASAHVHQSLPSGSLALTFNLVAEPAGSFALCVYVVNPSTGATEAHAAAHWTNS